MSKFHINKHGVPAPCKATKGNCPFGGDESHFDTKEEAQSYADKVNSKEFGIIPANDVLSMKVRSLLKDTDIEILDRLNSAGFPAYVVGGSVRDSVLDIPTNDVDITTSATPEEVMEIFSEYRVIDSGHNFGTVPLLVNGEPVEITTFRHDGEYSDGRRPDEVTFTKNIEDDIIRRDFTINAIAYNEEGIVDLVGGVKDAEDGIIRAVGDPNERFKEDPLRIMRGLRFASKLDFEIDKETENAIINNKYLLKNVSAERLQSELNGLIQGQSADKILTKYSSVITEITPSLKPMVGFDQKNPHHIYDVYEHSAVVVKNADDDIAHKLAGLFHDSGKPATFVYNEKRERGQFIGHADESVVIADKALRDLKYSNKMRERVLNIIIDHEEQLSTKPYKIKKNVYEKGPERFFDMINFKRADDSAKNPEKMGTYANYDKIESIANDFLENDPILSHKDLDIKPKDIIDLGYKGPQIKAVLNELCLLTIGGHKNDRDNQIAYLKKHGHKLNIWNIRLEKDEDFKRLYKEITKRLRL